MNLNKFESFIIDKAVKKETKAYSFLVWCLLVFLFSYGVLLVVLTIMKYNEDTLFSGLMLIIISITSFFIRTYQIILKKILEQDKKISKEK